MRPGVKVKLWSPKFTNRPDAVPPGLLKLVGILSIISVIGFLVFAVGQTLSYSQLDATAAEATYLVVLHFILPLAAFYTISVNSPLSRWLIVIYAIALSIATVAGKGVLGNLPGNPVYRTEIAIGALAVVLLWVFASPRMRYYYAIISNEPIPADLEARAAELEPKILIGPRTRAAMGWFVDNAASMVMLGFIGLMVFSCVS